MRDVVVTLSLTNQEGSAHAWMLESLNKTLRKHWQGDFLILHNQKGKTFGHPKTQGFEIQLNKDRPPTAFRRQALKIKQNLFKHLPLHEYDRILFLDDDSVVKDDPSPLFDHSDKDVSIAEEQRPISDLPFNSFFSKLDLKLLKGVRGINSGTFVIRNLKFWEEWSELGMASDPRHLPNKFKLHSMADLPVGFISDQPAFNKIIKHGRFSYDVFPDGYVGMPWFKTDGIVLHYFGAWARRNTNKKQVLSSLLNS